MGIRWKKFSHSIITKAMAFIVAVLCFSGAITIFIDLVGTQEHELGIALEDSYFLGTDYIRDCGAILDSFQALGIYKSEENILAGQTLQEDSLAWQEEYLFRDFEENSRSYNPRLSDADNYEIFKEVYASKIAQRRDGLIKSDLNDFHAALEVINSYPGLIYYVKIGEVELTNSPGQTKEYFQAQSASIVVEGAKQEALPAEVRNNARYYWLSSPLDQIGYQDIVYMAFTEEYLYPQIAQWEADKSLITKGLYQLAGFLAGLALTFIYLVVVIGRKPEGQQGISFNWLDRLYTDLNLGVCLLLILGWVALIAQSYHLQAYRLMFVVTALIAALGLLLVLSLIKHLKNRTLLKYSLTYKIFHKFFTFFRDVYNSGSIGVKIVLIVIGYPAIVALTFFMFPVTIGAAVWLAFRKVQEFKAIREGVRLVKNGDLLHVIQIKGNGEFAKLAADINGITEGLAKAVESEIKSERLKTELITNVSHDIRTPLTSIITYVDLLKSEREQTKVEEYLDVLDKKSQRLKVLTDDLFEAAKASSGVISVNLAKIDLTELITQGLGEFSEKLQERKLEFKLKQPQAKVYINADGNLFWRAVENLLTNVLKYALEGSRVYVEILDADPEIILTVKNISAYELNISAEELMERFKRGDEARSSQGSGLGLAITRSLIELQKGSFQIEIDGDLFKATIQMKKVADYSESAE